ncbi:uncharacterized protein TNCV_237661 [Trichonephila clavipes]|nr:uncharacterized protein TNCV_237661 [Trichonephila clavipes]
MWRSSRRLVCRVRPEPGPRVNDISQIQWSNTSLQCNQSVLIDELTRLADQPASIMSMILPSQTVTAAHIVLENGVMACLPQFFLCKRFNTHIQAFVTCFILQGERR